MNDVKPPTVRGGRRLGSGRKKVHIDLGQVEELARLFCSDEEIASSLNTCRSTIQRVKRTPEYLAAAQRGRAFARIELRRLQWKLVRAGNIAMTIFLGKVLLGQTEDGSSAAEPIAELRITVKRPLAPAIETQPGESEV